MKIMLFEGGDDVQFRIEIACEEWEANEDALTSAAMKYFGLEVGDDTPFEQSWPATKAFVDEAVSIIAAAERRKAAGGETA